MTAETGCSALVDARALQVSGIGRFLREVLWRLLDDGRFREVRLLGEPTVLEEFVNEAEPRVRVRVVDHAGEMYSPKAQLSWLRLWASGATRADVAFFPHFDAPYFAFPERSVVTVHDMIHFKVPEAFPAWRRAAAARLFDRVVRRARAIVVNSQWTKGDLVERHASAAEKILVLPFGVSDAFRREEAESEASERASALRPYLLCVGNRKPHKNLVAAVETLARVRERDRAVRLVVVGRTFAGWDEVLRRAGELGVRDFLVELDGVDDESLASLYTHCDALLFPSLYEGFGFPVLEAMSCGAPVIASDRASLPEVVGDAGLLVGPDDHAAMADAVTRVRADASLRDQLVKAGRSRAARYTWERAAGSVVDLLYRVAGGGGPRVASGAESGR